MSVATNTAPPQGSGEKNEGKPSTRPNPVPLEAAVTVTGARPSSEGTRDLFTEETRTILVFVDGAVIQLAAGVSVGQLLFLTNQKTKEEVVCQILQKRVFRPTVCYVEVQFTEDKPNFWGMSFGTEPAEPVKFKVAEQVAAQETTEDDHGAAVAPKSEQEIDELKRQVDSLRQQLQELEKSKAREPAARERGPANSAAPVLPSPKAVGSAAPGTEPLRPVHASGDEALLMPTAAPAEKKAPRWAVPMALPGWGKAEAEAPEGRDPSEELLPKPELDFSQLPSAAYAEESDPRSIYKPKGIPPHKLRRMALAIVLMGVLGVALYARLWTALPLLKAAVAAGVEKAENAVSKRDGAKANAPVPPAALTKSVATAAVVNTSDAGGNAGQPAPAAARETATKPAPSDVAASTIPSVEENPSERDAARKPEKSIRRNGRSQTVAPVEAKPTQAVAPDGPVLAPTLIHAAAPVYPPDAMLNYITGDVKAEFVVEADGTVGDVKVISGPKALRDAAIEALKKYEYAPGTQGGRPTAVKTTATVKFWFNP